MFGSKELAYAITMYDYELFTAINQVYFYNYLSYLKTRKCFSFDSTNFFIKSLVDINTIK